MPNNALQSCSNNVAVFLMADLRMRSSTVFSKLEEGMDERDSSSNCGISGGGEGNGVRAGKGGGPQCSTGFGTLGTVA